MSEEESLLEKLVRVARGAGKVAEIAKKVENGAQLIQGAAEKWNARRTKGLCPLCGEPPAAGVMFCERDLGKIAALGLRHADIEAVKNAFGKR